MSQIRIMKEQLSYLSNENKVLVGNNQNISEQFNKSMEKISQLNQNNQNNKVNKGMGMDRNQATND